MKLTAESLLAMNKDGLVALGLIDMENSVLMPNNNIGCNRCKNCNTCCYCSDCISCTHCFSCANGEALDLCTRVLDSEHCNTCHDCLYCKYCDFCTTCRDCMFCMYITNGHNLMFVAFGVQLTREQYIALKEKLA